MPNLMDQAVAVSEKILLQFQEDETPIHNAVGAMCMILGALAHQASDPEEAVATYVELINTIKDKEGHKPH